MSEIDRTKITIDGDPSGVVAAGQKSIETIEKVEAAAAEANARNKANLKEIGLPERASATDIAGVAPHNIRESAADMATVASGAIDTTKAVGGLTRAMNLLRGASAALQGNVIGAAGSMVKFGGSLAAAVPILGSIIAALAAYGTHLSDVIRKNRELGAAQQEWAGKIKSEGVVSREEKDLAALAERLDMLRGKYADLNREMSNDPRFRGNIVALQDARKALYAKEAQERTELENQIANVVAFNEQATRSRARIAQSAARDAEDAEAREAIKKRMDEERRARESLSEEAANAENSNRSSRLHGIDAIKEREIQAVAEINARRLKDNADGVEDYYKRLIDAAHEAAKIQAEAFAKEMQKAMSTVLRDVRNDAAAAFPTDQISSQLGQMTNVLEAIEARMMAGFQ